MEFLIIILLILLNGIFSMSEIALVSSRRFKLESLARKGHRGATRALELVDAPNRFLSTVQIGITLIGILLGIYSGENITQDFQAWLEQTPVLRPYAETLAVVLVLLVITYLSIVLGELFPKRVGLVFPETIAGAVARPMSLISKLMAPFVWLLTKTNELLLRLLGIRSERSGIVTEEEIKSIVEESAESGEIQQIEHDIVERVFAMGDRRVGALMTHRRDLAWLDAGADLETVRKKVAAAPHSVYPVAEGELDNILGIVPVRALAVHEPGTLFDLRAHLQHPLYVPETTFAYKLLEHFKKRRQHYAVVLDEYGSVQGLVTMDDLVDALVGDSSSDDSGEYRIEEQPDGSWIVDGAYPFFEFVRCLELDGVRDDPADFHTVAGLLAFELHRLPEAGDRLPWNGWTLEVLNMEEGGRRVGKVRAFRKNGRSEEGGKLEK